MSDTLTATASRRAGLGRRVADIVSFGDLAVGPSASLVSGPRVVPIDVVPYALLVLDGDGGVLMSNERWRLLSGLSPEESAGRGWEAAISSPTERYRLVSAITGGLDAGRTVVNGRSVRWARAAKSNAGQHLVAVGFVADEDRRPASGIRREPERSYGRAQPVRSPSGPDPLLADLADALAEAAGLLEALCASALLR